MPRTGCRLMRRPSAFAIFFALFALSAPIAAQPKGKPKPNGTAKPSGEDPFSERDKKPGATEEKPPEPAKPDAKKSEKGETKAEEKEGAEKGEKKPEEAPAKPMEANTRSEAMKA